MPVSAIAELDGMPLCLDYYFTEVKEKSTDGRGEEWTKVTEYLFVGDDLGICHQYIFEDMNWHACYWNSDL